MGDIAKGALTGAWSLLVGWVLPTAINLAVLTTVLLPSLRRVPALGHAADLVAGRGALAFLTASLMVGLVLNALQNPLYRILEGYLLWPSFAYEHGCRRHQALRRRLTDRLLLMRLERRAADSSLSPIHRADLTLLLHSPHLARHRRLDRRSTVTRRALLQERLARYPVGDGHLAPTRLGNAIRRFEVYAYDRYQLDSQLLWNELTATAPEQARRQVDTARTSVDFFICLLYGHIALLLAAAATLTSAAGTAAVAAAAVVLCVLIPVWYRCAVSATDEWAAAVRALVNVGRHPLAASLGLDIPKELAAERTMWSLVSRLPRIPYHEHAAALDHYRRPPARTSDDTT
ncbi:hypothetical protein EJ357_47700 [Streptomyces cyaneochromogenes]|uniref:Uncharacterized protein n=1 Tax=Streptomyces cyaneochromogenes TaxID=2496836 RepID=A0A3Q9EN78_9ACTN|nr:hypothetical protein [Streptomyces cyaneochromogenes]AZQ32111.1 hypothetical protein EJ357_00230 [Streptomyces cyaneochromogenes]AZQ40112.1 hypothetical protein EJ357_47700 [Streptomyces cyaneochromogenes]